MRSQIELTDPMADIHTGHMPQMFILLGPPGSGKDTIRRTASAQIATTGARWLSKCTTRPLKRDEDRQDVRTVTHATLSDKAHFFGHFSKNGNLYAYAVQEIEPWLYAAQTHPLLCIYSGISTVADLKDDLLALGAMYRPFHSHFIQIWAPITALKALTKGSAKDTVEIEAETADSITVINHVGGHAVRQAVCGLDVGEWPNVNVDIPTQKADAVLENYRRLLTFSSSDETRYVLNGVYVDTTGKGDRPHALVATDGRRLAMFNSMKLPIDNPLIIPTSKFLASAKLCGKTEIGVRQDDGVTWFGLNSGPWRFAIKAVDGTYPNYRQVIPAEPGQHVITFADGDVDLLKQVLPTFPGGEEITIVGQDGHVTLYGRGPDNEQWSTLRLESTSYTGDRSFIGLNRQYLLDALAAGFREFAITDELCPVLSRDSSGGLHVLMPCRVEEPEGASKDEQAAENRRGENETEDAAASPSEEPAQAIQPKRKKRRKKNVATEQKNETAGLDRVQAACDTARTKIKEAGQALTDLSKAIRDASREQKATKREVAQAQAAIEKIQSLKLAA